MSYIMINGNDNPRELILNGTQPQCLVYNGEIVWGAKTLESYRVYIEWDPVKMENITIDTLGYNTSYSITTDDIMEASYHDTNQWYSLDSTAIAKMVAPAGNSLQQYCKGIYIKLEPDLNLQSFNFKTDQYYQPTGNCVVTIEECYHDGQGQVSYVTIAEKTVAMAMNTTYTINRGDGV